MDKTGNGYSHPIPPYPMEKISPGSNCSPTPFQGPGGWYIENSLTTIGGKDPVGELNRELWNSGQDKDKETVRKQKRKLLLLREHLCCSGQSQSSE